MPLANREKRRTRREHRAKAWATVFRLVRANPQATADEIAGMAAAELQEEGGKDGFDISILLQLLVAILPFIMELFNRK